MLLISFIAITLVAFVKAGEPLITCEDINSKLKNFGHEPDNCYNKHGVPIVSFNENLNIENMTCEDVTNRMADHGYKVTDCSYYPKGIQKLVSEQKKEPSFVFRIDDHLNWKDSWIACNAIKGATLVTIETYVDFMRAYGLTVASYSITKKPFAWIGLTDQQREGHFYWAEDGSKLKQERWTGKAPDGGKEHNCVGMDANIAENHLIPGFNDADCDVKIPSICMLH